MAAPRSRAARRAAGRAGVQGGGGVREVDGWDWSAVWEAGCLTSARTATLMLLQYKACSLAPACALWRRNFWLRNVESGRTDDHERPGDLDGDHHRRVPEVLGAGGRQAEAEEERAEGAAAGRAAGPDGAREGPVHAGRPDGEPGRRWRLRVQLPGIHDLRLHGDRLLPRVLRARG